MSRKNIEDQLSDYIDALNSGREPKVGAMDNHQELEKLIETVQLVRTLKEPALPDEDYPKRLAKAVAGEIQKEKPPSQKKRLNPILNLSKG